ncbi:MAG: SIS domain-containing protein, partial [Chloroflexia bacterium]|nr:SIS domain-containing protein [Chloroflexia bacterium]
VGAAKFHETSHRQALAVNAEEYLHLVGFAVGATDAVIVVAPSGAAERERQVAEYAARQGALVVSLVHDELADDWRDGRVVPLPTKGLAIWSGALVAMTALHVLAERFSQVLGTNPDRPDTVDLDYALGLLYTAPLEGW